MSQSQNTFSTSSKPVHSIIETVTTDLVCQNWCRSETMEPNRVLTTVHCTVSPYHFHSSHAHTKGVKYPCLSFFTTTVPIKNTYPDNTHIGRVNVNSCEWNRTRESKSGTRVRKMADMLAKSYSYAKSYVRCDLREWIRCEQKSEDIPTHLPAFYRQRIVSLWTQGHSISSIVGILSAEGRETTRSMVR